uniref:Vacuolar protein sorting-associated protein 53 homolog n=1 Tax=Hirondellea gigas TaxID=1518452 RepID=A0A6A7G204_9CRUS
MAEQKTTIPPPRTETVLQLSPCVNAVLQEVLPSDDPLDAPDFDAVDFINKLFPDEASLGPPDGGDLTQFLRKSRGKINQLEDDISRAVRDASSERTKTENSIVDAREAIQELFAKVKSIKEKANESEIMVKEICRDIKKLDYAKKNLTATITALKRLHMLGSAVDQLQHVTASNDSGRSSLKMSPASQYEQAALNLQAVDILFTHFDDYKHVPKVSELRDQVIKTRRQLEDNVFEAFANFHRTGPDVMDGVETVEALKYACRVVDVLGSNVKNRLCKWMCSIQLEPYRQMFSPGNDAASLALTERRFAWLKRQLKQYHERYGGIFPRQWNVPGKIAADFCKMTHEHLSRTLMGSIDAATLLPVLQLTVQFEDELAKYYSVPTVENASDYLPEAPQLEEDMTESERIKRKYALKRMRKEAAERDRRDRPHSLSLPAETKAQLEEEEKQRKEQEKINFNGMISDCFAPHTGKLIILERNNIREVIEQIEKSENWLPDSALVSSENRFAGSDEILVYVKKSLQRCSQLRVKQILFDVYKEYKRGFTEYCHLLNRKLLPEQQPFSKKSENGFTESQLLSCCFIVNTSEYMGETLPSLEASIQKLIADDFQESIDFSEEIGQFQNLINRAIQVTVSAIVAALAKPLTAMSKLPWATFESTGDRSDYVTELNNIFIHDVSIVSALLSKDYHTFFCSELARAFVPVFIESVYRCRRINELATQQLLLDAHTIKTILQAVPSMGLPDPNRRIPTSYTKFVTKEVSRVQNLLKVLTSNEPVQTFHLFFPQGHPDDLRSVLELKGWRKSEQQIALQDYAKLVDPQKLNNPMATAQSRTQDSNIMRKIFKFA